jgi:hypothetical protein
MSPGKLLISATMLWFLSSPAIAQQQYIYPSRGQSPAQQEQDKYQCSQWATQQTGFNPTVPAPVPQAAAPPPPGMFGGAFRGAALGAIGGAIGGNAGKGAAIGAGVGGLFGGIRRYRYAQEQEYNADQQTSAYMAQRSNYFRAMDACLTGRGYTVS